MIEIAFLDTSALIKLFIDENGSAWLHNYVTGRRIAISELALFEFVTVLRRRHLEGSLTRLEVIDLFGQLQRNSTNYLIVGMGGTTQLNRLFNLAFNLPVALRIRALDSIQLTAANIVHEVANLPTPPTPFVFISSDRQLLQAAQSQGFSTVNPENYP